MSNIRRILLYFLSRRSLGRTEVVKYLYMYELYHRIHLGKPSLEAKFLRHHYGPYAYEIKTELDLLADFDVIAHESYVNSHGNLAYSYSYTGELEELTDDELEIADYVLGHLRHRGFQSMIDTVYSTPPMLKVLTAEEEGRKLLEGVELDMEHTKGTFKRTRQGREAAKRRLEAFAPRGTDEEYFGVLLNEYKVADQLRRRANSVSNRPHSR